MKIYNVSLEMSSTSVSPKGTFRRTVVAENKAFAVAELCSVMLKDFWAGELGDKLNEGEFVHPPTFHVISVKEIADAVNGW